MVLVNASTQGNLILVQGIINVLHKEQSLTIQALWYLLFVNNLAVASSLTVHHVSGACIKGEVHISDASKHDI